MDGAHGIVRSAMVTERVLAATFKALSDHNVLLEGAVSLEFSSEVCGCGQSERWAD